MKSKSNRLDLQRNISSLMLAVFIRAFSVKGNPSPVASGGVGGKPERPPPRNRKNYRINLVLSSRESEIQEMFSKKCEKRQFSIEILIKNSKFY